jgi:hypothetical protein
MDRKSRALAGFLIALAIALCLFLLFLKARHGSEPVQQPPPSKTDSLQTRPEEVPAPAPRKKPKVKSVTPKSDNNLEVKNKPLSQDTIPPYLYADPSGGLFLDSVTIKLVSDEPCSIYYKTKEMPGWGSWQSSIVFHGNEELSFYGMDTSGNVSSIKTELYDVKESSGMKKCSGGMAYVPSPNGGFCIDQYEWPNKKGISPQSMVSYYAAQESCESVGKKVYYSYGDSYEPKACNANGAGVSVSGSFVECRSYYGPMDMNGNLREWTSTRAKENPRFYEVRGGSWDSHSQSTCEESQYSFYPQNQHTSVGFRCCK